MVTVTAPPLTARLPDRVVEPRVKETVPALSVILLAMVDPLSESVPALVLVMVPPVSTFEMESVTPEETSTELPAVAMASEPEPVIAPLEELVIPEVDAKVSVVPESTSTVPPLIARLPERELLAANSSEPAVTVVVPEYEFAAPKTSVPTPDLVRAVTKDPAEIAPPNVSEPFETVITRTVSDAAASRVTPPVPVFKPLGPT